MYQPQWNPYGPGQWAPPPRNNVPAAILLLVGGLAGVLQFFVPWIDSFGQTVNGMDVAEAAGAAGTFGSSDGTVIQIGVYTVLVGGALALFAGVALFVPMRNRRVVGALSLVVSIAMVAGAICWLAAGESNPDSTSAGYYFFLGAGGVAVIGSIVALARG